MHSRRTSWSGVHRARRVPPLPGSRNESRSVPSLNASSTLAPTSLTQPDCRGQAEARDSCRAASRRRAASASLARTSAAWARLFRATPRRPQRCEDGKGAGAAAAAKLLFRRDHSSRRRSRGAGRAWVGCSRSHGASLPQTPPHWGSVSLGASLSPSHRWQPRPQRHVADQLPRRRRLDLQDLPLDVKDGLTRENVRSSVSSSYSVTPRPQTSVQASTPVVRRIRERAAREPCIQASIGPFVGRRPRAWWTSPVRSFGCCRVPHRPRSMSQHCPSLSTMRFDGFKSRCRMLRH